MNKNKKDYLTFTILCQFVVCVLLFGSVYGLKIMNSGMYNDLKKVYFNNLDKKFLVVSDEVVNVSEKEIETRNFMGWNYTFINILFLRWHPLNAL